MGMFGGFSQKQTWLYSTAPFISHLHEYATGPARNTDGKCYEVVTRETLPDGTKNVRGGASGPGRDPNEFESERTTIAKIRPR